MALYLFLAMGYNSLFKYYRDQRLHQDIEVLRARKRALANPQNPGVPLSYFDRLVNINVSNLEAYYAMVKSHTNNSFLASVTVGCVGFVLIITSLFVGFSGLDNANVIAYISAGSGVITEFISGVFFIYIIALQGN